MKTPILVSALAAGAACAPTWPSHGKPEHGWPDHGWHGKGDGLSIQTSSGLVHGFVNSTAPAVRQFLGVPYAEPPVGSLRFAPPVRKSSAGSIDATSWAPSCMQQAGSGKTIYTEQVPQFLINGGQSEDCLYLNIWAPAVEACEQEKLPVFVYVPGGGFTSGGADSVYKIPDKWIQRAQSHIVVVMNYRVNVFGFPNAKALDNRNVGLLDQRMVVEWTRDNIAAFGGDPERITFWGQSAGGASTSLYAYAWASDPIITGSISDSGVAGVAGGGDIAQTNFTSLAGLVGCGNSASDDAEIACVRKVDAVTLEKTLSNYINAGVGPKLSFTPVPDGITVFSNYSDRAAKGLVAKIPAIIGSNANEGTGFVPFTPDGPGAAVLQNVTNNVIACPVAKEVVNRATHKIDPTYRYQYAGNFSNVSPLPWMGAYHSSELPLIFGTHYEFRGNSTEYEYEVSRFLEALWLSFARFPSVAPTAPLPAGGNFVWPDFDTSTDSLVRFANGNELVATSSDQVIDKACGLA
ncbi:hypothetical protein B0A48_17188 [Cryoendolithus antarcticus]|uniref:Carboxylesterase type B domain-containing protein n=1 Tax=Cryoendolithus antarcticus TaxID=1507870 RepID=A0A1V8SC30_9PEZI|nr:hypothetical protein B0A48_17188 [Cryoendolithus antarcticus]